MKLIHFLPSGSKIFEPDGRKRLSFIKVGMNVHWYLVYDSLNIGLLCRGAEPRHTVVRLFVIPSFTSVLQSTLKGKS